MNQKAYIKDIIVNIIFVVAIMPILTFIYMRYFVHDIKSYYIDIETKMPFNIVMPHTDSVEDNKIHLIKIIIFNRKKESAIIDSIIVYGIKEVIGINIDEGYSINQTNAVTSIASSINSIGAKLELRNFPVLKPDRKFCVFIWGKTLPSNVVELVVEGKQYKANDAFMVFGIEEYFARYWKLNLFLFSVIIAGLVPNQANPDGLSTIFGYQHLEQVLKM